MAGTYTPTSVNGQLAAAKATLYTVPASTSAIVKTISVTNLDSVSRTFNIYFKRATSRTISAKNQTLTAGQTALIEFNHVLLAGDLIEGDASAATIVDYWISMVLET